MAGVKRKSSNVSSTNSDVAAAAAAAAVVPAVSPSTAPTTATSTTTAPAAVTNKILQNRLLAGLGNKGGARGSLTKCAIRLGELAASSSSATTPTTTTPPSSVTTPPSTPTKKAARKVAGNNSNSNEEQQQHRQLQLQLTREVRHQKVEMTKLLLQLQRNQVELESLRTTTDICKQQTVAESEIVQVKRLQLKQQYAVTACEREYEAVAQQVVATVHTTSRRILQQKLTACQDEISTIQHKMATAKTSKSVRLSQFQLLMQCMLDLKQSLSDEDDNNNTTEEDTEVMVVNVVPAVAATTAGRQGVGRSQEQPKKVDQENDAMEVEVVAVKGSEEDLYADL